MLTDADAEENGVDGEQSEAAVERDKRRRQSPDDEIHAEDRQTIDTRQISDEANHDADEKVGDADNLNKHSCLAGVKTDLDLTEIRQVDVWNYARDTGEEVGDSEHNEKEVGQ